MCGAPAAGVDNLPNIEILPVVEGQLQVALKPHVM